jgi:hypothetical protein
MKPFRKFGLPAMAAIAFVLNSCAPGGRSPSGFLANYRQLDAGYGTTDAVAAYIRPGADLAKYDSVLIEPVTTVVAAPGISAEVKDQLAAYLGAALRTQAAGKLRIASVPGPTTLRVRTALTDVIPGVSAGTPVTTVHTHPQASLTGALGSDAVAAFISNVSFEGELVDSVSGERISALCDHRIGSKREANATTTWASVRSANNQGAERLYQRFLAARIAP